MKESNHKKVLDVLRSRSMCSFKEIFRATNITHEALNAVIVEFINNGFIGTTILNGIRLYYIKGEVLIERKKIKKNFSSEESYCEDGMILNGFRSEVYRYARTK